MADRRAVIDVFEDAGFRIIGAQGLSVSGLHAAAIELHDALQRADVDRMAIVLSRHFVAGRTDGRLLGSDARKYRKSLQGGGRTFGYGP